MWRKIVINKEIANIFKLLCDQWNSSVIHRLAPVQAKRFTPNSCRPNHIFIRDKCSRNRLPSQNVEKTHYQPTSPEIFARLTPASLDCCDSEDSSVTPTSQKGFSFLRGDLASFLFPLTCHRAQNSFFVLKKITIFCFRYFLSSLNLSHGTHVPDSCPKHSSLEPAIVDTIVLKWNFKRLPMVSSAWKPPRIYPKYTIIRPAIFENRAKHWTIQTNFAQSENRMLVFRDFSVFKLIVDKLRM